MFFSEKAFLICRFCCWTFNSPTAVDHSRNQRPLLQRLDPVCSKALQILFIPTQECAHTQRSERGNLLKQDTFFLEEPFLQCWLWSLFHWTKSTYRFPLIHVTATYIQQHLSLSWAFRPDIELDFIMLVLALLSLCLFAWEDLVTFTQRSLGLQGKSGENVLSFPPSRCTHCIAQSSCWLLSNPAVPPLYCWPLSAPACTPIWQTGHEFLIQQLWLCEKGT